MAKRDMVIRGFKREIAYKVLDNLRRNQCDFIIPDVPEPATPSSSPQKSKREWEREFRSFKTQCQKWHKWVTEGHARSKTDSEKIFA